MHDALTDGAPIPHAPLSGLKTKDPTIPRRNAYAPSNIRADAERRAVRREQGALAARGAACSVCGRPWIARAAPDRVDALEGEKRLGDVRLGEDYGACCAERRDDLYGQAGERCVWMGKREEGGSGRGRLGKRTAASCSAGLLAHCVYPIVLSNPFTSTILHLVSNP
jgi:hypothetical protein